MAVLEKIRSKSVLLFIVIIGALLAFILGDFLSSGCSRNTTVAEVDGTTIDIAEFSNYPAASQNDATTDNAVNRNKVLVEMLFNKMTDKEIEELGIKVSDQELQTAIQAQIGQYQYYATMYQQADAQTRAYLEPQLMQLQVVGYYDIIKNPAQYGLTAEQVNAYKAELTQYEQKLRKDLAISKFASLYNGLITANVLDAQSMHNQSGTTYDIAYVSIPFSSIPDEEITVSEDDLKQEWEKNKGMFAIDQETRAISYINVNITPSDADREATNTEYAEILAALDSVSANEALIGHTAFIASPAQTATIAQLEEARKNVPRNNFVSQQEYNTLINSLNAETTTIGSALPMINGVNNYYSLLKVIDIRSEIDSINVSLYEATSQAEADSVFALINSGKSFKDITNAQDSIDVLLATGFNKDLTSLKELLTNSRIGQTFVSADSTASTGNIFYVACVNSRTAPVKVYDFAVISHTLEASNETINNMRDSLTQYAKKNNNAEAFVKNAQEAGFIALNSYVDARTPQITSAPNFFNVDNFINSNGIQGSYDAVYWAMTAEKGSMSSIFTDNTESRMLIVLVNDIYEDYLPYNDPNVKEALTAIVRDNKKAEAIIKKFGKANDLAGYASATETSVFNRSMTFDDMNGQTQEPVFAAIVAAASDTTKVYGPIKVDNAVVAFTVNRINPQNQPFLMQQNANKFNMLFCKPLNDYLSIVDLLRGKEAITWNITDFYAE
ncbi:MAG: SurA N-terminal domain-containing protein [Muribaculaceae bacterium]|nr:SurA N-terminal domain-containing protein [Muribaculaceae bacterium]